MKPPESSEISFQIRHGFLGWQERCHDEKRLFVTSPWFFQTDCLNTEVLNVAKRFQQQIRITVWKNKGEAAKVMDEMVNEQI